MDEFPSTFYFDSLVPEMSQKRKNKLLELRFLSWMYSLVLAEAESTKEEQQQESPCFELIPDTGTRLSRIYILDIPILCHLPKFLDKTKSK